MRPQKNKRHRVAGPSNKKVRLLREWLRELNCWRIPKTFMNNCLFMEADNEEEKMYVRGAFDAIRNAITILNGN